MFLSLLYLLSFTSYFLFLSSLYLIFLATIKKDVLFICNQSKSLFPLYEELFLTFFLFYKMIPSIFLTYTVSLFSSISFLFFFSLSLHFTQLVCILVYNIHTCTCIYPTVTINSINFELIDKNKSWNYARNYLKIVFLFNNVMLIRTI